MIGAIVRDNFVENLIVLKEEQIEEMSAALGCEIVDARPYGLNVGDLRTGAGWTRNAGGEQMILPLLEQESYDSYSIAAEKVVALEEQNKVAAELGAMEAADEVMSILTGEVTE